MMSNTDSTPYNDSRKEISITLSGNTVLVRPHIINHYQLTDDKQKYLIRKYEINLELLLSGPLLSGPLLSGLFSLVFIFSMNID